VSRYQKGKTNLDFSGARDNEWQWHQLSHLAPDRQPHQHPTTLVFFTGRMPFLLPNQQRQSTEGKNFNNHVQYKIQNAYHATIADVTNFHT